MVLNANNFLVYAMHHYSVPSCPTIDEFENDVKTLTNIRKNLARKEINTNLLLNQIITTFNCFGAAALHLLFFKCEREHWGTLATFLLYIHRMPETIPEFGVRLSDLTLNEQIIQELRKL